MECRASEAVDEHLHGGGAKEQSHPTNPHRAESPLLKDAEEKGPRHAVESLGQIQLEEKH
jgi:hypothetical protein